MAEPRLKAAEQQVNCDDSQVKSCVAAVKGDGLEGNQSQGDDSPATALRLTSNSVAINRSEAASHDEYENENCLGDGNYKLYTLNTKQENINTILRD